MRIVVSLLEYRNIKHGRERDETALLGSSSAIEEKGMRITRNLSSNKSCPASITYALLSISSITYRFNQERTQIHV